MADNNLAELSKYFRIIQPSDLLGKYQLVDFKGNKLVDINKSTFVQKVVSLLINTGENQAATGLPTLEEIVKQLNDFISSKSENDITEKQFHDFLRVYSDTPVNGSQSYYWKGDRNQTISFAEIIKNSQKKPKLGVIQTSSPFVSLAVRNTNKTALFMNAIPTLEFSRAVPYLDVRFQFNRPQSEGDKRLRVPSLIKFLEGAVVPKDANALMSNATIDKQTTLDGTTRDVFKAGMELFTSPQTLVNPSNARSASRYTRVLDPFRPFMSLTQLEITVVPTVGLFVNKTAKLSMILHDRSRLGEISDLVRPEVYTNTTLSLSYGWKHPDGVGSKNAFGDLINRMAVHNEKYGIVNCSFSFDQVGQCHITLQLATKGTQELRVLKIADGKDYHDQSKFFAQLTADIAQLREDAGLRKPETLGREVRAYQILDVAERGQVVYDAQQLKEIRELITKLKSKQVSKPAMGELADKLDSLFAEKKGVNEVLKGMVESRIADKFKELEEGEDPFLQRNEDGSLSDELKLFNQESSPGQKKGKRVVSLAKVFLTFVGSGYQAIDNVDEVQFFFYQFNGQAGKLGNVNIGSFPIEIQYLRTVFDDHAKAKDNPNMTVLEFLELLQGAIIQDPRAIGYGLRQAYTPRTGKKDPEVKSGVKIENVLEASVKNKGSFKYPVVEAQIETLAGRPIYAGDVASDKAGNDILRIHIYDKAASPYEPMLQMVKSQSELQDVIKAEQGSSKESQSLQAMRQEAVSLANKAGLNIQYDEKTSKYRLGQASYQSLKDFITQVIPTITYGSNSSAVINGTLQTQQNQLLSTVQMMREAGRQNNTEPNGSAFGGIPLRVIPAQLDLNSFGCPLLNVNQQFFIDFQTGTTVDNIYLLTHLVHTIKPGKFESHIKFAPLDAYGVFESVVSKVQQLKDYLKDS
jgi:hypothetical protein